MILNKDYSELIADKNFYRIDNDLDIWEDIIIELDKPLYVRGYLKALWNLESKNTIKSGNYIEAGRKIKVNGSIIASNYIMADRDIYADGFILCDDNFMFENLAMNNDDINIYVDLNSELGEAMVDEDANLDNIIRDQYIWHDSSKVSGDIVSGKSINSKKHIKARGHINAKDGNIIANDFIKSDSFIESNQDIRSNGEISSRKYIKSGGKIIGLSIVSGKHICAHDQIRSGLSLKSGDFIEVNGENGEIIVDNSIYAQTDIIARFIKAGNNIISGRKINSDEISAGHEIVSAFPIDKELTFIHCGKPSVKKLSDVDKRMLF